MKKTLAFIGAGNMAAAIIHALFDSGYDPQKIWVSNPSTAKLEALQQKFNVNVTQNNQEAAEHADVIILCVKPHIIKAVCEELSATIQEKQSLIISVAAGVSTSLLTTWLSGYEGVIRCMPNTPVMVEAGVTALYAQSEISMENKEAAESIFRSAGVVFWAEEEAMMPSVIAVSGSSPAYYFLIMEAMQAVGESFGFSAQDAALLVAQTALGSAKMALESESSFAELRRAVTSPNGTTEQAIRVLEDQKIRDIMKQAMQAAADRAREITEQLSKDT